MMHIAEPPHARPVGVPVQRKSSSHRRKGYWADMANCRAFLCDFAKKHGFDPMVPENWYNVTYEQLAIGVRCALC